MKRLTVANQNNDLYTILSIEMESTELIGDIETKETATSDELLKIYNSILKDQVEALENDIDLLYSHPKYITINQCISDPFYSPLVSLKIALNQALYASMEIQKILKKLQGDNALNHLKEIIKSL
jgi:hypothetical protein